jgi:deoxyribodipyrimidine photo-lyase
LGRLKELAIRLGEDNQQASQAIKGKTIPREFMELMPDGMQSGGAHLAWERLETFLQYRAAGYGKNISSPIGARHHGSRLSAHLAWGNLSMRQVFHYYLNHLKEKEPSVQRDLNAMASRLRWHCHFIQKFESEDRIEFENLNPAFNVLDQEFNEVFFEAWKNGKTGYPIVDAGMRELLTTGFMHNRVRMVVASFLTKHLLIDWRWGERYFAEKLIDFDLSANNGGWQWAASTGCDAQPWFRIFNPITQSEKFDSAGKFIRKYVPELTACDDKEIHAPWLIPALRQAMLNIHIGKTYPVPIVDHATQRNLALSLYKAAREPILIQN